MEKSKYPVLITPSDSGLNSERNPYYFQMGEKTIPFFQMNFETDWDAPVTNAIMIRSFEMRVRPLNVVVDLNFAVRLVKSMVTRRISESFMLICKVLIPRSATCYQLSEFLLNATPSPKHDRTYSTIFVKSMVLHRMSFQFILSLKMDRFEVDQNRDLIILTEYSNAIRYLTDLSRSVTVINPKFDFFGVKLENSFDRADSIIWGIAFLYISQAVLQSYKLFGSMDAIGDPVGVIKDLTSSLKSFLIHSGLELSGQTPFRAEGLKHLAQGIIGSPIGSLGKVSRGFGQLLGTISNLEIELGQDSAPAHIGEGVVQAAVIFASTLHTGVVNVVKNPYQGIQDGSVVKTVRGTAQGILGLAFAPAIGTFGAVTKITQSIDQTTHVFDKKLKGRMRPRRPFFFDPVLRVLSETAFIRSFSFSFEQFDMPLLSLFSNYFVCIICQYGAKRFSTTPYPCEAIINWSVSDGSFYFPVKAHGDNFKDKKLLFKVRLIDSPSSYVGSGYTIARGDIHPLHLTEYLAQV